MFQFMVEISSKNNIISVEEPISVGKSSSQKIPKPAAKKADTTAKEASSIPSGKGYTQKPSDVMGGGLHQFEQYSPPPLREDLTP
ncbi:hypothetical protein M5689_020597 [Euphorbia peplus]|nr:hypothetical protein M5689_020597 [Euphorbia peplus]